MSDHPSHGFRSQQRFTDPATDESPPPEWTDPTPPTGIPVGETGPHAIAPPYPELSTAALLRQSKRPPSSGWRRLLYLASGKTINLGESPKVIHHNDLLAQVNRPLQGCYRIALLSLKGGVGKTTITATLGATFASIRGDRVVAVDANPDRGTLSQKVPLETPATVRHLLRDAEGIERYSDVRSYTSQGPSRLEVLASESDPAVSEAFSAEDYARTLEVLERFYSLVLTDCGTGLMHSAMSSVLAKADVLIVISSGSVDGARSASATLDWLDAHGHEDMVQELDRGDQRGAPALGQGRHAEGRRSLLPALPGGAAGAVRPASRRGGGDQPGAAAARDARGIDRTGGGGGRGFSGHAATQRPVLSGAITWGGDCPRARADAENPGRRRGRSHASSLGRPWLGSAASRHRSGLPRRV